MNTPDTPGLPDADHSAAWNPIMVRDLVRETRSRGLHPALLEVGREESLALRRFLADAYGEDGAFIKKDTYYLGLEVVEVDVPRRLAVTGCKPHGAAEDGLPPLWTDAPGHAA